MPAFDPDAFLAEPSSVSSGFDPDAFLAQDAPPSAPPAGFDPDAFLADENPVKNAESRRQPNMVVETMRELPGALRETVMDPQNVIEPAKGTVRGMFNVKAVPGDVVAVAADTLDNLRRNIRNAWYNPEGLPGKAQKAIRDWRGIEEPPVKSEIRAAPENKLQKLSEAGRDYADTYRELKEEGILARDPETYRGTYMENPSLARVLGSTSESLVPMAVGLAGKGEGLRKFSAALMTATESLPEYHAMRDSGMSQGDALANTMAQALGTYALEKLGLDNIALENPAVQKAVTKLGGKWLTGAAIAYASEGGTEGLQQIYQNALAMGYDGDRKAFDGVIESVLGGGLMGAGLNMTQSAASGIRQNFVKEVLAPVQETAEQPALPPSAPAESARGADGILRTPEGVIVQDQGGGNYILTPENTAPLAAEPPVVEPTTAQAVQTLEENVPTLGNEQPAFDPDAFLAETDPAAEVQRADAPDDVKYPWELTRKEWADQLQSRHDNLPDSLKPRDAESLDYRKTDFHKAHVWQAVQRGEEVPAEVLADYPDLKKQFQGSEEKVPDAGKLVEREVFRTDYPAGRRSPFTQRSAGRYVALDAPFDPSGGVVSKETVSFDPRKIYDPNGLLEGTDIDGTRSFDLVGEMNRVAQKSDRPLSDIRTEVLKKHGYDGEVGLINDDASGNRELIIFQGSETPAAKILRSGNGGAQASPQGSYGGTQDGELGAAASGAPMLESIGLGAYAGAIPFAGPVAGKAAVGAYWQQQGAGDFLRSFLRDKNIDELTPEKLKEYNTISQSLAVPYAAIEFTVASIPGMKALGSGIDQQAANWLFRKALANPTVLTKLAKGGTSFGIRWALESLWEEGAQGAVQEGATQLMDEASKGDRKSLLELVRGLDPQKLGKAFVESGVQSVPAVGVMTAAGGAAAGVRNRMTPDAAESPQSGAPVQAPVISPEAEIVAPAPAQAVQALEENVPTIGNEQPAFDPDAFLAETGPVEEESASEKVPEVGKTVGPEARAKIKPDEIYKTGFVEFNHTPAVVEDGDVVEHENWKFSGSGDGKSSALVTKYSDGEYQLETDDGFGKTETTQFKEFDDARASAEKYIQTEDADFLGVINQGAEIGTLLNTLAVPSSFKSDSFYKANGGSIYFNLIDDEGRPLKLSIRDHEPSPFREKEFGAVDHFEEVKNTGDLKEIGAAMDRLEMWLKNKSGRQSALVSRGVRTAEARKPTLSTRSEDETILGRKGQARTRSGAQASPQDLEAQATRQKQSGFVAAPDRTTAQRVTRSTGRFLRRWLTPSAGLDRSSRVANLEKMYGEEAARVEGMMTRQAFKSIRKELSAQHGREGVQSALEGVVYGDLTPEQFGQQFGLALNNPAVETLRAFNAIRAKRSAALADLLEKNGNPTLAERVRENEAYVSRFYLKHAMGDEFTPKPEDYQAAVTEIRSGIEDVIEKLGKRADKAAGEGGRFQRKVINYLNTGNDAELSGLSESRAAEIRALKKQFSKISQVIESVSAAEGGGIDFAVNAAALDSAARATIDFYLTRENTSGDGRPDVSNLKRRFLGEAFRKLYGEVRDPVFAAAATAENQSRMLAQLTFFNRMAIESENKSWSGMPSAELGTIKRLDNDNKKYGLLAGKYVTPELYEAIHGEPSRQMVTKFYKSTLSTMRMLKLIGPKTIGRNYATALTGFALGSGDVFRSGYWSNFKRGNDLVRDVVAGKPAALAELRELVRQGAFSFHGNTQMEEVQRLFSMDPRLKLSAGMKKLGDLYSMIDLPSKAASFYTNRARFLARGMSEQEASAAAAKHVQQFYQNPRELPRAAFKLSRLPISDFIGYFWDSARIRANQTAHAVRSARQAGDLLPSVGLILSGLLTVGMAYMFGAMGRDLWRKVRSLFRDSKDKPIVTEDVSKQQARALRSFMPDYYENAPLMVWRDKSKDGTVRMYYTITGGNGAFPIEDMIIGALQGSDSPGDFFKRFGTSVAENRLGPGMLPSALYKAATGDDLMGGFHTTGVIDVIGRERPDKDKVFVKAGIRLMSDVYGGQFGSKAMQMYDLYQKDKAGAEPVAGSYTPYQSYSAILGSMFDPTRTYEINADEAARMVRNRLSPFAEGIQVSKGMAGSEMKAVVKQGAATEQQRKESEIGQRARTEYIETAGTILAEARKAFAGVLDESHLWAIASDSLPGASEMEVFMMLGGAKKQQVPPYIPKPSPTKLQMMMGR